MERDGRRRSARPVGAREGDDVAPVTEPAFQRLSVALSATYSLQRELGGGGMSRVYLATDRELGREVVVKTLPPDLLTSDAVERFKREIRTAARLQHPNIVPLLSAGEAATAFKAGTGIAVGTPAYMAPEQFAADPSVDHRADIYAWGIVAYEVLGGHHPFEGTSGTALLHAHLSTTPKRVATLTPDVP